MALFLELLRVLERVKVGITANIAILHPAARQVTSLEALGKALCVELPITEVHTSELVQHRLLQDFATKSLNLRWRR